MTQLWSQNMYFKSRAWWYTPIISVLGMQRWVDPWSSMATQPRWTDRFQATERTYLWNSKVDNSLSNNIWNCPLAPTSTRTHVHTPSPYTQMSDSTMRKCCALTVESTYPPFGSHWTIISLQVVFDPLLLLFVTEHLRSLINPSGTFNTF